MGCYLRQAEGGASAEPYIIIWRGKPTVHLLTYTYVLYTVPFYKNFLRKLTSCRAAFLNGDSTHFAPSWLPAHLFYIFGVLDWLEFRRGQKCALSGGPRELVLGESQWSRSTWGIHREHRKARKRNWVDEGRRIITQSQVPATSLTWQGSERL